MKKRFTAWLLAVAMMCSVVPMAFAANEPEPSTELPVSGGVGSVTELTSGKLDDNIKLITMDEVPADAEVLEVEEASLAGNQNYASKDETKFEVGQVNYSAEANDENFAELTTTQFSSYGVQLPNLVYTVDTNKGTKYIKVGTVLKKVYDNVMADLRKGYNSVIFQKATGADNQTAAMNYRNNSSVKNLGAYVSFPTGFTANVYEQLMRDMSWVVYRCVDMDSTDMFFSNGFAFYAYQQYDNRHTGRIWVAPLCYKGYTTLTQRKNLKAALDREVASVVKQAEVYLRAYDKIKFFHDWLCKNNSYNYAAVSNNNYPDTVSGAAWSSTGAMLSHTGMVPGPVCESYSRALQLLCSKVGINATVVTSDSGEHMWSNLRYGQFWSGVDVTWDDGEGSQYNYNYFMKKVNNMSGHAMDDPNFVPWLQYPALTQINNSAVLPYYDVPKGFWGEKYIQYVYDKNLMSGMNCVNFGVSRALTRAQFATILYNMAGKPNVAYTPKFKDVPNGQWYTKAVLWVNEKKIASGYANGNFGINDPITREQIALMLYKFMNGTPVATDHISRYPDASSVDGWARTAMNWAIENKIISGVKNANGTYSLDPIGRATRTQCATMITKVLKPE